MYEESEPQSKERLHASLALLPVDPDQVDYLYERLLNAGPTQLPVIRDALLAYRDSLVERLWKVLGNAQEDPDHRFRAACVLATYDPGGDGWQNASKFVTDHLLTVVKKNPSHYSPLLEMLRPVRQRLIGSLAEVYRNREQPESERSFATTILADYASNQPSILAGLLMDADEKQFAVIFPKFKEQGERGLALLTIEMDRTLPADMPSSDERRETLAKRQANAAVALLKMNQPEKVWPLLKHGPDPRTRSYLIHRLGPLGVDAGEIIKRLDEEPDETIRRALLLSLGEFDEKALPPAARQTLLPKVQDIYRTDTDPGLHGAAEWLLRTWQQASWQKQIEDEWAKDKEQRQRRLQSIQQLVRKDKEKAPPQWYVNTQGQTMVVIPGPVEFRMGSPSTEEGRFPDELQHQQRIGRTIAVAAAPVTVRAFRQFLKANHLEASFEAGGEAAPLMKRFSPDENGPIITMSWYTAVAYCNWLSQRDGIPEEQWCYETNARKQVTALKRGYLVLGGYRLPTEAEWEYACRAGAVTSRYYGETEELLEKYAWYAKNARERAWPVGSKKPNDLGLFDMHGNVFTWCQEQYNPQPQGEQADEDKEGSLSINPQESRVLRGGSFISRPVLVRSAYRARSVPTYSNDNFGLRPARTFTP
jgi:formylglycine-generating enzyme required for sulfatase activity